MATWKKVIVSGSDAILNKLNVGTNQQISTAQSTTFLTGSFTGSFKGDGSNLTGIIATSFDIDNLGSDLTANTVAGTDKLALSDNGTEGRINVSQLSTPLAGTGLEANSGTIRIATAAAGAGLTGGGGSALGVGEGDYITVEEDAVNVNTTTLIPAVWAQSASYSGSIIDVIAGDVNVTAAGVSSIGSGVIVNDDVNASAAIAYTKLSFAGSSFISASTLSSPSQGSAVLTVNGVAGSTIDLGLQNADSPSFVGLTLTGDAAVNGGDITTTATTATVFNTTATTVNAFGAATTLNIGGGSGTTTVGNSLVVAGDLTVNGDLVTVNTTNLPVEDKFILLASGSATAGDGGIVIDRGSDAAGNIAFGFDSATDRWGYQNGLTDSATGITIGTNGNSAFAGYVFTEAAHVSAPTTGEFVLAGAIYTATNEDIFIYS